MFNLGSGIAQGMMSYHKGYDEQVELTQLREERAARLEQMKSQTEGQNLENQKLQMQLKELSRAMLKQAAGTQVLKAGESIKGISDALVEAGEGAYSIVDGKLEYKVPEKVQGFIDDLKHQFVYDETGADWANQVMGFKTDVTDVFFDGDKGEIVFKAKDGEEKRFTPLTLSVGLGLKKQAKWARENQDEANQIILDKNHKNMKNKLDLLKSEADISKSKADTAKTYNDIKVDNAKVAIDMEKNDIEWHKLMMEKTKGKYDLSSKEGQSQYYLDKFKELLNSGKSDLEIYDAVMTDPIMYEKVMGSGESAKRIDLSMGSLIVTQRLKNLGDLIDLSGKGTDQITLDDKVRNIMFQMGVPVGQDQKQIETSELLSYIKGISTDVMTTGIKLKSGAAFSEQELNVIKELVSSLNQGKGLSEAKTQIKAAVKSWSDYSETQLGSTNALQRKVVYGSRARFVKYGNKALEDMGVMVSPALTRPDPTINVKEMGTKLLSMSPEQAQSEIQKLSPQDAQYVLDFLNTSSNLGGGK